jgi:hypothetical protein
MTSAPSRRDGGRQSSGRDRVDGRRPVLGLALALFLVGGCSPLPAAGLRPVPPVTPGITGDSRIRDVKSFQPTLRWEAFPRPEDLRADSGRLASVRNVTYELRIWRAEDGSPGQLVYARSGMTEPMHAVEAPLAPETIYLWTMRARFELHGEPRVTPWGVLGHGRDPVVPHPPFTNYGFWTPKR